MQFEKIRHKDTDMVLGWSVPNGSARESRGLKCDDVPEDAFVDALQALKPIVLRVNQLPQEYAEHVTVHTVTIDRDDHGKRGVLIHSIAKVPAGSYSLPTPRLREPADLIDEGGPAQLREAELDALAVLEAEAKRYVDGARTVREPGGSKAEPEPEGEPADPFDPAKAAEAEASAELAGAGAN